MNELVDWRTRHHILKMELLKLSNRIVESTEPDDKAFYQEMCERYGLHLKKIETECYAALGVTICSCHFNHEKCHD